MVLKEKEKKYGLFTKILAVILFLFIVFTLIIIKVINENFKLSLLIILSVIVFILCVGLFFLSEIIRLFKENKDLKEKEDKLPKPITYEEVNKIAIRAIEGNSNLNKIGRIINEGVEEHGKGQTQAIYCLHCEGVYKDNGDTPTFFVGVNMHFPDKRRFMVNPTEHQIKIAKNRLSTNPEEPLEKTVIKEENVLTGIKRETTQTKKKKDKEKEEKKLQEEAEV